MALKAIWLLKWVVNLGSQAQENESKKNKLVQVVFCSVFVDCGRALKSMETVAVLEFNNGVHERLLWNDWMQVGRRSFRFQRGTRNSSEKKNAVRTNETVYKLLGKKKRKYWSNQRFSHNIIFPKSTCELKKIKPGWESLKVKVKI